MSIQVLIAGYLGQQLWQLLPEFADPTDEFPRTVLVTEEVASMFRDAPANEREAKRFREARAVLDSFSQLGLITMAENPFDKDATAIMARVDPVEEEIWDFRCLDPTPGLRILGCFYDVDCFVALTWDYRENFDDQWPEQVAKCKTAWIELFDGLKPHAGKNLNEYVSENYIAV